MQLRLSLILIHGQMKDSGYEVINMVSGWTVMKLLGYFIYNALQLTAHVKTLNINQYFGKFRSQ